jgi:hypothetical protein
MGQQKKARDSYKSRRRRAVRRFLLGSWYVGKLERGVKRLKERFQRGAYQVRIKKETKRLVKKEGKEENL